MFTQILITKKAEKTLIKVPKHILIRFEVWIEVIEVAGFNNMQKIKGYRDHQLKGDRKG